MTLDKRRPAWTRALKGGVVPAICFALVGVLLFPLGNSSNALIEISLIAIAGTAVCLEVVFRFVIDSHGPSLPATVISLVLWAIGMQVLWLPYLAVVWKRPVTSSRRVLAFVGVSAAVIVVNVLAFVVLAVPFMGGG